jgi:hypothetical protein
MNQTKSKRLGEFETRYSLEHYQTLAREGSKTSVKRMMESLNSRMTLAESKFIDFALGQVENPEGVKTMEHYFFHGTKIQRNYCALYFSRRGDHKLVRAAFDQGLIDDLQAFSR